ncbi:homeodomain-interacting protein kinase 1-like [Salarias fasciatus]|uniref:homeodomain-interacting protein kinase 1-like n=1 Tax=Salarias fasciatus TaxID=181472 RepID=UPI0011770D43|nr:homeodomain-interacting protein kinase 1-like [Salarias fasciatus]
MEVIKEGQQQVCVIGTKMSMAVQDTEGSFLFGASSVYNIQQFIGEGSFGKVARCRNVKTSETVAVKVLKKEREKDDDETIGVLNPDVTNLVKFFECFTHLGHTCLVFEMLDISLYHLLKEREWKPMCPSEIRPIAEQLMVALGALKRFGILHADIKPDNVMLVDAAARPFRAKLIDFGEAVPVSKVTRGMQIQAIGYRAPEVCLGLPFSEAVDTAMEFRAANHKPAKEGYALPEGIRFLEDMVNIHPVKDAAELEERKAFIDLLKGLLHLNGDQRLTPRAALRHPFMKKVCLSQDPHSRPG